MIKTDQENIQVLVRIRPLNSREKAEGAVPCMQVDPNNPTTVVIDQKNYNYDYISGAETSQEDIFHIVGKPVALAWLEGYNACIFAYGQTGAGKTFTMQGRGLVEEGMESPNRGLQPRVFDYVFSLINSLKVEHPENEYSISCNYLEIYNEQIMDLLSDKGHDAGKSAQLSVREDLKKGVYVENLTEENAITSEDAINLLIKGSSSRHVGATKMNADSSRSHSVFSLNFESKVQANGMVHVKNSKLHFVDLAGSERQKSTQASGDRLKEASNINKSLTVLGQVINALVESANGKSRHIPYRDSKLTFILKDSLGGNSRTFMIAACSEANTQFQETLSTLKFAQRAKMIKNKASVNEESQGNLQQLKKEIAKLKEDLAEAKKSIKEMEENQSKMTKISTPGKYSPSSSDHTAVIQFQQKNFQEMTDKLGEIHGLLRDFDDSRSKVEDYFLREQLGVLQVFNQIVEDKKNGLEVDVIKALTTKMDLEYENGANLVLGELDQKIVEEIQQMNSTNLKIREFDERRKEFLNKMEDICLLQFSSPEKELQLKEIVAAREHEITTIQNNLQAKLLQHDHEMEEAISMTEFFKSKTDEYTEEINSLQAQIEKNHQVHEERVNQFKEGFENKLAEYDETTSEMKIKNMELADMIDEHKEQIEHLTHLRDQYRSNWETEHENYQNMLHMKNQLEEQKEQMEAQMKFLEQEKIEIQEKLSMMHELSHADKVHITNLNDEIANRNAVIVDNEMQFEFLNSKHEEQSLELQEMIQQEKNRCDQLEEDIVKYKDDIDSACTTLDYLNRQADEKRIELAAAQEQLRIEVEKREKSEAIYNDMIENQESPLNQAVAKVTRLEDQLLVLEKLVGEKQQEIKTLDEELEEIKGALKNSENSVKVLQEESDMLKGELSNQENILEEASNKLNEQTNQLAETSEKLKEAIEKCAALESIIEEAVETQQQLEEEKQQLIDQITQKDAIITEESERLRELSATNDFLKAETEELIRQLEDNKERSSAFEKSLQIVTSEKEELIEKESQLIKLSQDQKSEIYALEQQQALHEKEFREAKVKYMEQQYAAELVEQQLDSQLKQLKEEQIKLMEVNEELESQIQKAEKQLNQAQEDNEMLTHELKEKEQRCIQADLLKEQLCISKNKKIEELIDERKTYENEFNIIQEKYSQEIQNIALLQQTLYQFKLENATVKKQLQDGKEQMDLFLVEKAKFESERLSIQKLMEDKEAVIKRQQEEFEEVGKKFQIFRTLNEQLEEQKTIYQQKYKTKSKDLDSYEKKYNNLESNLQKINEQLVTKQLENNKLQNQLLIIQSNREKNQSIQEDLQRDLKKEREERLQIKTKYEAMLLEGRLNKRIGQGSNVSEKSDLKKAEEKYEELQNYFTKYKTNSEKIISEIADKFNKKISVAEIIKDLKSQTDISKKLEEQTQVISQKNDGLLEIANVMKVYLQDCRKGSIDSGQREEFISSLQNPLEDLGSLSDILKAVMHNVEERERKVAQDALLLKEKKAQYEFYRSKCEELEFKYEKKSKQDHSNNNNNSNGVPEPMNRKRKNSFKENDSNILTEVDVNKKQKPNSN